MYALMLLNRADLLGEYETREGAEGALDRLFDHDERLGEDAGIFELDGDGRPVGDPITRRAAAYS